MRARGFKTRQIQIVFSLLASAAPSVKKEENDWCNNVSQRHSFRTTRFPHQDSMSRDTRDDAEDRGGVSAATG